MPNKKKLYGPFLWMGFNYKARITSRKQFIFLPLSSQKFLTSEGWKAESTLEPPSGLNLRPLDWESSALTTRPRMFWIASSFSSFWSPFVFKMLGSCESFIIKQPVICWHIVLNRLSFYNCTPYWRWHWSKSNRFTSFVWANLQFSGGVTLVNKFLSSFWVVSIKATDTTLVTSSDAGSPQFSLAWL